MGRVNKILEDWKIILPLNKQGQCNPVKKIRNIFFNIHLLHHHNHLHLLITIYLAALWFKSVELMITIYINILLGQAIRYDL